MLSQSVAAALRDAISAGEFQPGQQLSEVKAAERFECSRNTLREAFTELASERLVERIPHRGVFIAVPDTEYVKDLYLARMALEHAGVLWGEFPAAERLVELTSSARRYADSGDPQAVSNINQRFHRALVASLGSATLDEQMQNLLARMRLTFLLVLPRLPEFHYDYIDSNVRLATLIAAGEREEAATVSRDSLLKAYNAIRFVL